MSTVSEDVTIDQLKKDRSSKIDLSTVRTAVLLDYVDKVQCGGLPEFGQGLRLKRVMTELRRRSRLVYETSLA